MNRYRLSWQAERDLEDILVYLKQPYIIFYNKIAEGIEVVRVLHQERDIDNLFP